MRASPPFLLSVLHSRADIVAGAPLPLNSIEQTDEDDYRATSFRSLYPYSDCVLPLPSPLYIPMGRWRHSIYIHNSLGRWNLRAFSPRAHLFIRAPLRLFLARACVCYTQVRRTKSGRRDNEREECLFNYANFRGDKHADPVVRESIMRHDSGGEGDSLSLRLCRHSFNRETRVPALIVK